MNFINQQRGNALVIVLLALALFAALSFTITSSSRDSSTKLITDKEMNMAVQDLLRHAVNIENAIDNMRMLNNVSPAEISFESADAPYDYSNGNCGSDICKIFSVSGGGIPWQDPPAEVIAGITPPAGKDSYQFFGSDPIYGHGSDGTSAGDSDLYILTFVNAEACKAINKSVGLPHGESAVLTAGPRFQGSYSYSGTVLDNANLNGHKAFCADSGSGYQFIYVLLPR
ncbi:MAG: hypothetical protein ACQEQL_02765 [Pseudomonadota bacterium]